MDDEILHDGRLEVVKVLGPQQRNEKGYDYVGPLKLAKIDILGRTLSANL